MKPWETMRRLGHGAAAAGGGDPYFAYVVSLLNFQGTHGSATVTDEKGKAWTVLGDAHIEVSGGESYGVFDGAGDKLSTPDSGDFNFGAGEFCMEAIITPSATPLAVGHIAGQFGQAPNMSSMLYTGGPMACMAVAEITGGYYDAGFDIGGGSDLSAGVRAHVAMSRSGDVFRCFLNGVVVVTKTDTRALFNSTKAFYVGGNDFSTGQAFAGKIHAMRVTKGVARYTAPFTPPAWPLPTS